ncbi:RFS6 [Symbiodinium sp. CCMP2592]|nr:RFS6 [Symbiodinium sp. CCMP2592]
MAVRFASRSAALKVEVQEAELEAQAVKAKSIVRWQGGSGPKEEAFELYPSDRGFEKALALYRHKPPWTAPQVVRQLSELPGETLFVLADTGTTLVAFCPLANLGDGVVASLRGSRRGLDDFELVLHIESRSGDGVNGVDTPVLLILECMNLGAAAVAHLAAQKVAQTLRSLGQPLLLRSEKLLPELFGRWGWCSWDAHGVGVKAEHLKAMAVKHSPPWLVLDDGWQEDVSPEEWRRWLHTPQTQHLARPGFGSLQDLAEALRGEGSALLVWHTLLGYWGGVAEGRGFSVTRRRPLWPSGLQAGCPGEVDVWDGDFYALKTEEDAERFYIDFYAALADAGVTGVKCDGQFLAEVLVGARRAAELAQIQAEAAKCIGGQVISCMAITLPCVHGGSAVLTRVSDDHAYPGVPEDARSVARHIWHCAANSLWLAPFVHCDWDMLKTGEWHAAVHAATRAVAGCPVYASDPAESFDPEVLTPLLLPDGTGRVVPCKAGGSAVPIDRHCFLDPSNSAELLWLRNETAGGHVAAAFGLCDTGGSMMRSTLFPSDVGEEPESCACLQVELCAPGHAAELTARGWDVQLHFMGFMVLAIAPILSLGGQRLAVFGLAGVWNPTGTLAAPPTASGEGLRVPLLSPGSVQIWSEGTLALASPAGPVILKPGLNCVDVADSDVILTGYSYLYCLYVAPSRLATQCATRCRFGLSRQAHCSVDHDVTVFWLARGPWRCQPPSAGT